MLTNERKRYSKYRTTLSDLTHSLKTPLAVLQSTLRLLRSGKQMNIEQAEPIMLEQIGRILNRWVIIYTEHQRKVMKT